MPDENAQEYRILGRRVSIAGSSPAAQAIVARVFGGFDPADSGNPVSQHYKLIETGDGWDVRAGESTLRSGADLTEALAALESDAIVPALAERSDLIQLHAASLCLPARLEGLALAGGSGMGKTTLAVALMLQGFSLFSDDVVLADPVSLNLSPFRRSVHLSAHSREIIADALGAPVSWDERDPPGVFCPPQFAKRPAPLKWLFFLERDPSRKPGATLMSPTDAAMAILAQAIGLPRQSRRALDACGRITRDVRCMRLVTGELGAAVRAIQEAVAEEPAVV